MYCNYIGTCQSFYWCVCSLRTGLCLPALYTPATQQSPSSWEMFSEGSWAVDVEMMRVSSLHTRLLLVFCLCLGIPCSRVNSTLALICRTYSWAGIGRMPQVSSDSHRVSERSQWLLAVKWRDFPFRFGLMSWSHIHPQRLLFTKWWYLPESSRVLPGIVWGYVCLQSTERTNEMTYYFIFCPRNSCSYWHTFCFWGWDCFSQFGVRGKCSNIFISRQQLLPYTMLFHGISYT